MSHTNTHPNTPFGKFFDKLGIWHESFAKAIIDAYNKLEPLAQTAIKDASGIIAIVNSNLQAAPPFIFTLIQEKFPDVNIEMATAFLNRLNASVIKVGENIPQDFDTALTTLQDYLSKFHDNGWVGTTRMLVSIGATILHNGLTVPVVETVLEYVYLEIIKPHLKDIQPV